ncbi:MAG: MBL fold metallo-hydrolase [Albidovulum sp.]|uniref:MBL fold metallo-hydrolase n=1 Tax=Albidovulum sp. TaxID=1872424 RepID=UPI003CAB541F
MADDMPLLAPDARWEDGWFALQPLDEETLAIGEPIYLQRNWSYLISDRGESLLFDAGCGVTPISPLVARHGRAALKVLPSHMHYDHLGDIEAFDHVMVADLPDLRACTDGAVLMPTDALFLGAKLGLRTPRIRVAEWVAPQSWISVGARRLQILHTPGHSPDSIALWEPARNRLYAADFLYRGVLYAQVPGASLRSYRATCAMLLALLPEDAAICGAHGRPDADGRCSAPVLATTDLADLARVLDRLIAAPPAHAKEVPVNDLLRLAYSPDRM